MKGQVGLETLFVFGFLITIFLMAFFSYLQRAEDVNFASDFLDAQRICDTVRGSVNGVHTSGLGSAINFTLPQTIGGSSYNVTVSSLSQSMVVSWKKYSTSCVLITRNVTNSTHNFFVLSSKTNQARNLNGTISLQQS